MPIDTGIMAVRCELSPEGERTFAIDRLREKIIGVAVHTLQRAGATEDIRVIGPEREYPENGPVGGIAVVTVLARQNVIHSA